MKRKHPDTIRMDWLQKWEVVYMFYGLTGGRYEVYMGGQWHRFPSFRKAIDAAMRHQRQNGGKS